MSQPRSVLFVCVSNRGKSVMAEGLARTFVGGSIAASSAGTAAKIGAAPNDLSAEALAEVGADITGHTPRQLTDELMRSVDMTVMVGTSAVIDAPEGIVVEVWEIDEPSLHGIDGIERMRRIRDELIDRIKDLSRRLAS
ncbi:low molecular weight phosphatase family protein [Gordonia sp. Z-3]|uniref:Low molecular weight phosphatase family protein n=2 Tax=Gordonia TaxID=2053 RepID=A0A9X3D7V1_9ACTN|nr:MULTISPECIES: low molecular weight phosphatase family protein [Gordonia]MAU81984.1 low molecular weight phosphatase family protein [Gordonia sp. (in: high G+C Gram-positive bacteria)]MCF3941241.1 low molecular weight phosphatase family protein [Gordonia tangerina]MCX2966460.1 low molecular weight phosphatase family protein [Gordonia aquimaris]MED5801790.1 low molecular weight phosphatase family protein [Gordonia sp. Z-3]